MTGRSLAMMGLPEAMYSNILSGLSRGRCGFPIRAHLVGEQQNVAGGQP